MSAVESLKTIKDWVRFGASEFTRHELYFGHGTDNAWDEALFLILHCLAMPFERYEYYQDARLTKEEREAIAAIFNLRITTRKPAAYLTGHISFAGLPFIVNEHVLVPRSPIAELIEDGFDPWLSERGLTSALELCTGSGCIANAIAYYLPECEVIGTDILPEAIDLARDNAEMLGLSERVGFIESDMWDNVPERKFDLIISNPPYVDAEDMEARPDEYRLEPDIALASGMDGLDHTLIILSEANDYLNEDGLLIVEVGNSEEALSLLFPEVPFTWLEFANGGAGIFLLTKEELAEHTESFREALDGRE